MLKKRLITLLLSLLFTLSFTFAQQNHQHFASHFLLNTKKKTKTAQTQVAKNNGQLTLQSKAIDAQITGFVAAVKVEEVYQNQSNKELDATYIVPTILPEGSLHKLEIKLDDRIIKTDIVENKEVLKAANQRYSTKLLAPQLVEIRVPNIPAHQKIEISLFYTQILAAQSKGIYQFLHPKLPEPIFEEAILSRLNDRELGNFNEEEFDENTPLTLAMGVPEITGDNIPSFEPEIDFTFEATIRGNIELSSLKSMSYDDLEITTDTTQKITKISYESAIKRAFERDFVFQYTLNQKENFGTNLWLSEGDKKDTSDNYFLLSIHAPQQLNNVELLPNDYTFILDLSNSIPDKSIKHIKELLSQLPQKLAQNSTFNISLLDEKASVLDTNSLKVNTLNIAKALSFIDENRGGTNGKLSNAVQKTLNFKADKNSQTDLHKAIVIVTDGLLRLDKKTYDLLEENVAQTTVFALGLGHKPNDYFINGLANFSNTKPFIINDLSDASKLIDEFGDYLSQAVLKDLKIDYKGIETYDIIVPHQNTPNQLYADQPLVILGKYKNKSDEAAITVGGKNYLNTTSFAKKIKVIEEAQTVKNQTISYLWALSKVKLLNDYNVLVYQKNRKSKKYRQHFAANKHMAQKLGIKHQILNDYTKYEIKDSKNKTTEAQIDFSKEGIDAKFLNKEVNEDYEHLTNAEPLMLSYYMDEEFSEILPNYSTCFESSLLDNHPKFPGGLNQLYRFLQKNRQVIDYQASGGSVWVSLLVNPDGSVSDIEIEHSTNDILNAVAINLIKKMPNWTPALKSGKAVATRWSLPIPISF